MHVHVRVQFSGLIFYTFQENNACWTESGSTVTNFSQVRCNTSRI